MFSKKYKKVITIEGMQCEHCAKKIENALGDIEKITKVKVDLKKKEVTIISSIIIDDKIITDTINNLDYKIVKIREN